MPLYEFRCLECGKIQEELLPVFTREKGSIIRPDCHPENYAVRIMSVPQNNTAMQSMADNSCVFVDQYPDFVQRKPKKRFTWNPKTAKWKRVI